MEEENTEEIYNYRCRIGNWYETYTTELMKAEEFQQKIKSKELLRDVRNKAQEPQLKQTQLTKNSILKSGDYIQLKNLKTNGVLATDLSNKQDLNKFGVTTSTIHLDSITRNTFIITAKDKNQGDDICFDDLIYIQTLPEFNHSAYYLASYFKTPTLKSKSDNQQVLLQHKKNQRTLWKIQHHDASCRLETEGLSIPSEEPITLKHVGTNIPLASNNTEYYTDFGLEREVCCKLYTANSKMSCLMKEATGESTVDTLLKSNLEENFWKIC